MMVRNYLFPLTLMLMVCGLSVSGCTLTPQPIKPQDDIKPGRGLLTGEKGYFEILPSTETSSPSENKTADHNQ